MVVLALEVAWLVDDDDNRADDRLWGLAKGGDAQSTTKKLCVDQSTS
jgi:hypothetical protein